MEKQHAMNIVPDHRLMLENVPVSPRGQGLTLRPFSSAEQRPIPLAQPVPAESSSQPMNYSATMTPASAPLPALFPESSVLSMGNAEVDLAGSTVKMAASRYLLKPFAPLQLKRSVESGMKQHRELSSVRLDSKQAEQVVVHVSHTMHNGQHQEGSVAQIERLAAAAEMRDEETGGHIARTGIYAGIIARGLGLPEEYAQMIALAATVHDVGKIGIQDAILSKPAQLTSQEYEIMKTHTVIGEQILSGSSCPLLRMAASIALSHHERWDGSGYPYGLAGQQIPLPGRIVMLADQYDALRSRRVYKRSLDHASTCAVLSQGDAVTQPEHFDPLILKTFLELAPQFAKISEELEQHELTAHTDPAGDLAAAPGLAPSCAGRQGSISTRQGSVST